MADDDEPEPGEQRTDDDARTRGPLERPARRRPGAADGEKALGLQVAKLFGISPRLLMMPASAPPDRPPAEAPARDAEDSEP